MKQTSIEILDFIQKFDKILENYKEFLEKKEKYGFNIFSVSSYSSHLENFHSDVLYSLLFPNDLHNESVLFIEKFFEYIKVNLSIDIGNISNIDFNKVKVFKEIGDKKSRIDILITYKEINTNTTKTIIFENKINNAQDQDNQLERYYNWCKENNYEVISILYVSLDGYKIAPKINKTEINKLIKDITFYDNTNNCLVNGWLKECSPTNEDTKSFLNQYIKLLISLGINAMNKENMEQFYKDAGTKNVQEQIQLFNELNNSLPNYRATRFFSEFVNQNLCFSKFIFYRSSYPLFEGYKGNQGDNNIKIDLNFGMEGKVNILFWNNCDLPPHDRNKFLNMLYYKLSCKDEFKKVIEDDIILYKRSIELDSEFNTISIIDNKVYEIVRCLLTDLSNL